MKPARAPGRPRRPRCGASATPTTSGAARGRVQASMRRPPMRSASTAPGDGAERRRGGEREDGEAGCAVRPAALVGRGPGARCSSSAELGPGAQRGQRSRAGPCPARRPARRAARAAWTGDHRERERARRARSRPQTTAAGTRNDQRRPRVQQRDEERRDQRADREAQVAAGREPRDPGGLAVPGEPVGQPRRLGVVARRRRCPSRRCRPAPRGSRPRGRPART